MTTMGKDCGCKQCATSCGCPACTGLATAERPLFGTGMTLSAADLTALQDYVVTKNRLHNRYQHGWGVVCGLEVLCHDCEGSVTIRPGYAIDPCGDDIVVADAVRFDVLEAIRDCTRLTRRRGDDCDPWMPAPDEGCGEALSHWCIALKYREVETAVSQRLTTGGQACQTIGKGGHSDCGCGGHGGASCGCGGSGGGGGVATKVRARGTASVVPTSLAAHNVCAPRRVRECYEVELVARDESCAPRMWNRDPQNDQRQPFGMLGWLIPAKSLLRNIMNCVVHDITALSERITGQDAETIGVLAGGDPSVLASSDLSLDAVHSAVCRARAVVLELLQDDFGTTRCQLLRATAEAKLAPPSSDENRADYIFRAQGMLTDLLAAWVQSMIDCICRAFLPDCPEDPCDDKVEIACISVKAGKILSICNHSCRKYAGSFPAMNYWLSLIPLAPLFARLLAMMCCQPDMLRRNSPLVNDLIPLLDRVDPSGNLRAQVVKDDFAQPRRLVAMVARLADVPVTDAILAQVRRGAQMALNPEAAASGGNNNPQKLREEVRGLREELEVLKAAFAQAHPEEVPAEKVKPKAKTRTRAKRNTPKKT